MKLKMRIATVILLGAVVTRIEATGIRESGIAVQDSLTLQEVVVTGSRSSVNVNNLPMSVSIIPEEQMERRMEPSILPLITEQVPSLFITSRGVMGYGVSSGSAGTMTMRGVGGAPTTQLLMLIDGHPQYMGLMGHPLADSYQTLLAERIEVVRGPASVLYGSNAMGGVINIITREQKNDGVNTHLRSQYGSYNTLNTELSNAVRKGKFNSYLAFGYNRSDGHRENMGFEQFTGYAKLGYDLSPNWKSFVDLDLTNFESSNPGEMDAPMLDNDLNVTRGVTSFSLQNSYDRSSGALKVFYNWGIHKINDGYRVGETPRESRYRSTDRMVGITLYQSYSLFKGNQTTAGIDYQHFGGHAWNIYLNGNPNYDMAKESVNEIAGYVNFQQTFFDKLTLNAGVRVDHHAVTETEWIPQAGISWFAGENTVVKGIVSKGFRNPTIRELYMFGMRNPDLESESLMNYELSVSQSLYDRKLQLGANIYFIKGKNSIILVPQGEGSIWMNTGNIENYGLELTGNYRIFPNLSLNASYSYLHMENKVVASPEHKLYGGLDYSLNKWVFSTGVQFVQNLFTEEGKETFTLWNARLGYRFNKYFDLFARGENLLSQKYEINSGFPMPGTTLFGGFSLRL